MAVLNPSQKEALGEVVERTGVALEHVPLVDRPGCCEIVVRDTEGCRFAIRAAARGGYRVGLEPGPDGPGVDHDGLTWDEVVGVFARWMTRVKVALASVDPWACIEEAIERIEDGCGTENRSFGTGELKAVEGFVADVRAMADQGQDGTCPAIYLAQLERLVDLARRGTGRIDWKNHLVGLLLCIWVAGTMTPARFTAIVQFCVEKLLVLV